MSSSEREQLKPCPWCNGMEMLASSNGYESHMVVCNGCGAEGPAAISAAEAFTAWNRRAQARAEPCAWEVRRLDPVEGPSIWLHAHRVDIEGYRRRPELYELRPLFAAPQQAPLTDEQIDDLHGDSSRGFSIERDDYFKAFRDAELAHGISAGKEKSNG